MLRNQRPEQSLLRVQINGERREVGAGLSLLELVQALDLKPEQIAIELNRTVVRRAEWASTILREDDSVEVVHFVGGGFGQKQGGTKQGQVAGGSKHVVDVCLLS